MLPANRIANVRRRVNRARQGTEAICVTCPASLAVSPEPAQRWTQRDADEWAERHEFNGTPSDVFAAFEDAATMHLTRSAANHAPVSAVAQPPGSAEALHTAVAAIYFDDSSDYLPALWSIVRRLDPGGIAELLERDGNAAWHKTIGMADAARGIGVRSTTTEGRGPEGAEPGPKDAPKSTGAGTTPKGWCKACGPGNDRLGYAHLESCPRAAPQAAAPAAAGEPQQERAALNRRATPEGKSE